MRRAVAIAMLLSTLALVAAGCGGGNSDKKANEAYAKSVCTALGTWVTEVKSLATVPSGGINQASITAAVNQFQTATNTMISQVKAVPPPNTSEGQAAKKQINQLASTVKTTSAAVKSAASQLPANASVSQIISALSGLVPQFTTLINSAQSTAKTIQSAGGSLADAFKSERACKQLG
jgi:ABC-type glycerol-3-phosphate transport system substrate-binding protein